MVFSLRFSMAAIGEQCDNLEAIRRLPQIKIVVTQI
jgi:hypothetical protein